MAVKNILSDKRDEVQDALRELDTKDPARERALNNLQLSLDAAGFAPGYGETADLLSALVSLYRGNYGDAALSALSAIPLAGWYPASIKAVKNGSKIEDAVSTLIKYSDEITDGGEAVLKHVDDAADAAEAAGKNADSLEELYKQLDEEWYRGETAVEGAGDAGKIPWDSWQNYEKVTANGQEYAKVGNRLYSKHAVDRMQPSGKRFTVGDAIVQAGGVSGRSVAPQFVEAVIGSVEPVFQPATGNYIYASGTLKVVTNKFGYVVTIMTVG